MASNIDPTKPGAGAALTADVRSNFAAAKSEIEALQTGKQPLAARLTALVAAALAADTLIYGTGLNTVSVTALTAFARTLLAVGDAAAARALLDVASTATVDGKQPSNATLTALAALVTAANKLPYATGAGTFATTDLTAFARTLLAAGDATTARTLLDVASTTTVAGKQPSSATLTALAALVTAADKLPYATGAGSFATTDLTAFARTLLATTDAAAARTLLGAGTGSGSGTSESSILPVNSVTGTTQAMAVNNSYIANNAGRVTLTLPAASAVGDVLEVLYFGAGGWRVSQLAGQSIIWGSTTTTPGVTDGLQSAGGGATVRLRCVQANTVWEVISYAGAVAALSATTQSWDGNNKGPYITLSAANLSAVANSSTASAVRGFAMPMSGKWYWEIVIDKFSYVQFLGVASSAASNYTYYQTTGCYGWYIYRNQSTGQTQFAAIANGADMGAYGVAPYTGNVVGVAADLDNGKLFFAVQNVYQNAGNPITGANPACALPTGVALYPWWGHNNATNIGESVTFRPAPTQWTYPAPSGFNRLP